MHACLSLSVYISLTILSSFILILQKGRNAIFPKRRLIMSESQNLGHYNIRVKSICFPYIRQHGKWKDHICQKKKGIRTILDNKCSLTRLISSSCIFLDIHEFFCNKTSEWSHCQMIPPHTPSKENNTAQSLDLPRRSQ